MTNIFLCSNLCTICGHMKLNMFSKFSQWNIQMDTMLLEHNISHPFCKNHWDIKQHRLCMPNSCKVSSLQDTNCKCFDLSNLHMEMYMICINYFLNKCLKDNLKNNFLCRQTILMYILYNSLSLSHISYKELNNFDRYLLLYWQMFLMGMSCNKIHYKHTQLCNCCNNTYLNMLNRVQSICYKFLSYLNNNMSGKSERTAHYTDKEVCHYLIENNLDNKLNYYHKKSTDTDNFGMWNSYDCKMLM